MSRPLKTILVILLVIVLSAMSIKIFTMKVENPWPLDLSGDKTANIANSINGLASPVIAIITIVLVYWTFSEQKNESVKRDQEFLSQLEINNFQIIIALFKQLEEEHSRFYYTDDDKDHFTGDLAFLWWFKNFKKKNELEDNRSRLNIFKQSALGGSILYLVNSLKIISDQIELLSLSLDQKLILTQKVSLFYMTKMRVVKELILIIDCDHEVANSLKALDKSLGLMDMP